MLGFGFIELLVIALMVLVPVAAIWFLIWILRQAMGARRDIHALREDMAALRESGEPRDD